MTAAEVVAGAGLVLSSASPGSARRRTCQACVGRDKRDTAAIYPKWSIDWLSVTVFGMEPNEVAAIVSDAFHEGSQVRLNGWSEQGGPSFYRNRYEYLGASLLYGCFSEGAEEAVIREFEYAYCKGEFRGA
ncbi:MAG: hypothetical protein ACREN8_13085 [Candidatus Dormibacteraceae bacterium]